jgi:hypothetical protein
LLTNLSQFELRDFKQAAKLVVDIATGQVEDRGKPKKRKADARPLFEICEWKIGGEFYVRANESAAWLYDPA